MLQLTRFQLISIYHYIVQTISSSYVVLPFIRCSALPLHLKCTLLVYSHKFFFCAILSIVVKPFSHKVRLGFWLSCRCLPNLQEFPKIHRVFLLWLTAQYPYIINQRIYWCVTTSTLNQIKPISLLCVPTEFSTICVNR